MTSRTSEMQPANLNYLKTDLIGQKPEKTSDQYLSLCFLEFPLYISDAISEKNTVKENSENLHNALFYHK